MGSNGIKIELNRIPCQGAGEFRPAYRGDFPHAGVLAQSQQLQVHKLAC